MLPDAYLTIEETEDFALRVADTAAWAAAEEAAQSAALIQASDEIDTLRFAGERYDADQAREFPRVLIDDQAEGPRLDPRDYGGTVGLGGEVWDLDEEGEPCVPERVRFAAFLQALSILRDPARAARLRDRHDGLVGQQAGGASESYDPDRPVELVCLEARRQLGPYLLRSGRPT